MKKQEIIEIINSNLELCDKVVALRPYVLPSIRKVKRTYRHFYIRAMEDQDVEQVCMMELVKCISKFSHDVSDDFLAFYKACIERAVKSLLRTQRQNNNRALYESVSLDKENSALEHGSNMDSVVNNVLEFNPEYAALEGCYRSIFAQTMQKLSEVEREIVALHIKGFSYKEIMVQTNTSIKKVDNTIQKVRKLYRPLID
ncbi:MAG: sigma-70 family RNA polymerase sigma factor [Erysipelotrichaceae bacterium]